MNPKWRIFPAWAVFFWFAIFVVAPSTGWTSEMAVSPRDQDFAKQAAAGGMAEVEMGKLAVQQAADPAVKAFGAKMIKDHSKANRDLEQIAFKKGLELPKSLDPEHKAKLDALKKESGLAFDKAYIEEQVTGHEKMRALLESETKEGQDVDLKRFAAKTLPTVERHHKRADQLSGKLSAR
jgi:putative membrane protein